MRIEEQVKPIIRKLSISEVEAAGRVLGEALMVEPGYAAIFPDEAQRRQVLVGMLTEGVARTIPERSVLGAFDADGTVLGAALWSAPRDSAPAAPADGEAPRELPLYLRDVAEDQLRALMAYDAACLRHLPEEPFWYLQILGVDPAEQGRGVGSALMHASLAMIGSTGHPAYLETGTERNVRFYERFGFQVRAAGLALAPGSTPHWTMIRRPGGASAT